MSRPRYNHKIKERGLTPWEFLIVVAMALIAAAIIVVILSPSEFFIRTLDSQRLTDLQTIDKSLALINAAGAILSFGSPNIVYTSLPDENSSACTSYSLPALPLGWQYHCETSATYKNINGTGWIPVDFSQTTIGAAPLSKLPVDPINTAANGFYYTYVSGPRGGWELDALMEARRHRLGGSRDQTSIDSGDSFEFYEVGTDLRLSPISDRGITGYWNFDETSGTTARDVSRRDKNGNLLGSVHWVPGKVNNGVSFDAVDSTVLAGGNLDDYQITASTTFSAWVYVKNHTLDKEGLVGWSYGSGDPFYILIQDDGAIWVYGNNQKKTYDYILKTDPGLIQLGKWYHVVFTYDGSEGAKIYINGNLIAVNSVDSGPFAVQGGDLAFAAEDGGTYYPIMGILDDARIYDRALSPAEIMAIFNGMK